MAEHGDSIGIHPRIFFERVEDSAESPGPGTDGTAFIGRSRIITLCQLMNSVVKSIVKVGVDVTVVSSHKPIAASNDLSHIPSSGTHPSRRFRSLVACQIEAFVFANP